MKKVILFFCGVLLSACQSYKVPMVPTYQQIPVIQVKKDDTLYSLARRYDTTVQELVRKNNIADPTALQVGQDLKLPKAVRVATYELEKQQGTALSQTGVEKTKSVQKKAITSPAKQNENMSKKVAKNTNNAKKIYPKPNQKMKQLDKPFVATGKVNFGWPVKGKIISSFGVKGGGIKNDGINIAVKKGTAIKAAEAGIVVYAGNELKGYGNLLLIRHEKEFMSAYAHADKLLVKTGDVVAKGDKIATVGMTGNVQQPQLHFEIRKKTKSVNPKKYLQ